MPKSIERHLFYVVIKGRISLCGIYFLSLILNAVRCILHFASLFLSLFVLSIPTPPLSHSRPRNRKRIAPLEQDIAIHHPAILHNHDKSAFTSFRSRSPHRHHQTLPNSRRASVPPTSFAASEGQMVIPASRSASNSRIAASPSAASASPGLRPRQASLQYFITSPIPLPLLPPGKRPPTRLTNLLLMRSLLLQLALLIRHPQVLSHLCT